ncbi:hypothetical protein VCHA38O210_60216 [Vibrio chagasii]|nr:hypothetical protein VCHA38O210_60216 [Vibrio chagasii]
MRYHLYCFGHTHNKLLKSDSQRVAFYYASVYVFKVLCGG